MTRELERIERIMYKIGRLWVLYPDQRFFQLLYNYTQLGQRDKIGTVRDPFYYEDSDVETQLDYVLKELIKEQKKFEKKKKTK